MHTRMFRVGEVARCLTSDAHCPETKKDHIVGYVCVSREVTEMGHGGASEEDDKAKDRDGEVRGVQSLTPNKRHLGRFAIVGVEVNALVRIRVPAFFASVLPQP